MAAPSEEEGGGEILIDLREFLKGEEGRERFFREDGKISFEFQLQDPSQVVESVQFSDHFVGIKREGFHCLLDCLDRAFCDHYQIRLTPDDFLLPLIQASAAIENLQAKEKKIPDEKKIELVVRRDDFALGRSDNPWNEIFAEFRVLIAKHVGEDVHELYQGAFSTTQLLQQCGYDVALMDACKSRFTYRNMFRCGIPCVRLAGNGSQDWNQFEERAGRIVNKIAKKNRLGSTQPELTEWRIKILDVIRKISESGRKVLGQDEMVDFWKSLYRWDTHSGGAGITGWINLFFPIVNGKIGKLDEIDGSGSWARSRNVSTYPSSYCSVPVQCDDRGRKFDLVYYAGHVGTSQDDSLVLSPSWGWAVTRVNRI
eukprot:CAMPEP_0201479628 /NCGR_PEP_ID=MMETSP0151_2-20130828/4297_1 /ASSEMBLY_ACC=CAM_ASM_000257 /TAXON_ID=200890 /ORGANISM="Paramoeba atlantica, Strain 621/1 / CCAP 1560/9" /LENGTH=369 /DNA_ID=CAMNT_0047861209 /DNA_START=31 /DNA_END=1140 /DNA_ORIENTATION=-